MKKKLKIFLLLLISLSFGISKIKAETVLDYSSFYDDFDDTISWYNSNTSIYNNFLSYYQDHYSDEFPYYSVKILNPSSVPVLQITFSDTNNTMWSGSNLIPVSDNKHCLFMSSSNTSSILYDSNCSPTILGYYSGFSDPYSPFYNNGYIYNNTPSGSSDFDEINIPYFSSSVVDFSEPSFVVEEGNVIPSYLALYNEEYSPDLTDSYVTINLNSYSYVILSLNTYEPINSEFYTNIYTYGKLCLTTVYDYGMKEKKDYYSGFQTQGCTEYYRDFTPVKVYILPQDVENHAVYYLKSSNTSITNSVKVDTNIFNITYITSQNSDNPSVTINGRSYPTIPYDDLTDTAIISDEEGYVSGRVCGIGDVNCYYETQGIEFSDIFSHPLEVLQDVWSSISTIFTLITGFLALLPPTLQSFLFSAFMLAIVLGLLKIIIG